MVELSIRHYSPSVTSAQAMTVRLLRNSITAGSKTVGMSWPSTAVAMIASQRSLKPTESADFAACTPPIEIEKGRLRPFIQATEISFPGAIGDSV